LHGDRIVLGYMVFSNFPTRRRAAQIAGYISIFSDVSGLIKLLSVRWCSPRWWWASPTGLRGSVGRVRQGSWLVHHASADLADPR